MAAKKDRDRRLARSRPNTPQGQRTQVRRTFSVEEAFYGPLPAPADLERYDVIVPGMAERLLTKFEQQTDHRMTLESHVIRSDVTRSNWGLAAAFVFGLIVLGAAVYLVVNGYENAGIAAIIVEFLTYGGIFIYGSETRRRERNRKRQG